VSSSLKYNSIMVIVVLLLHLFRLVPAGHTSIVKLILETAAPSGADRVIVNHEDENGEAPTHVATRCGSTEILELLIAHGANLGLIDGHGRTCLHLAAQSGRGSSLALSLDSGADEYLEVLSEDGFTALHLAVRANKADCVRILLEAGADVSAETASGTNVYNLAPKQRSERITRLLLEYDVSDGESSCGEGGIDSILNNGENLMRGAKKLTPYPTEPNQASSFPSSLISPVKQRPMHQNYCGGRSSSAGGTAPLCAVFPGGIDSSRSLSQITHSPILKANRWSSFGCGSASGCISDGYGTEHSLAGGEFICEGETWMIYITEDGHPYFYNADRNSSTWEDPRLQLPAPRVQHALQTRNLHAERPASASFRRKLTAIPQLNRNSTKKSITGGKDVVESMDMKPPKPGPTGAPQPERAGSENSLMAQMNSRSTGTGGGDIAGKTPRPVTSTFVLSSSKSATDEEEVDRKSSLVAPKAKAHSQAQPPGPAGTASPTSMMLDEAYTERAHATTERVKDTSGCVVGETLTPSSKAIMVKKEEDLDLKVILLSKITSIPMDPSGIIQAAQPLVSPKVAAQSQVQMPGPAGTASPASVKPDEANSTRAHATTERVEGTSGIIVGETLTSATSSPPPLSLKTVIEEKDEITSIPMGPSSIIQAVQLPAPSLVPSPVTPGLALFGQIKSHRKGNGRDIVGEKLSISPTSMKPTMEKKEDTYPKGAHETALAATSSPPLFPLKTVIEEKDEITSIPMDPSSIIQAVQLLAPTLVPSPVTPGLNALFGQVQSHHKCIGCDIIREQLGISPTSMKPSMDKKEDTYPKVAHETALAAKSRAVSMRAVSYDSEGPKHLDVISKYMKMKAVGIPVEAILHKMMQDGAEAANIDLFRQLDEGKQSAAPNAKLHKAETSSEASSMKKNSEDRLNMLMTDEAIKKFMRMVSVGVPAEAVANKMKSEGIEEAKIAIFNEFHGIGTSSPDNCSLPPMRKASEPPSKFDKNANIIPKEDLAKDGTLSKYIKMSNVGVPLSAVLAKMSQDGIDNEKINIFNVAFGLKTAGAISPKRKPTTMQRGQRKASKAMQKIHWTTVAEERLQDSLWASNNGIEIKDSDIEKLESLFSASPKNKSVGGQVRAVSKTQEPTRLIDPKRAVSSQCHGFIVDDDFFSESVFCPLTVSEQCCHCIGSVSILFDLRRPLSGSSISQSR
jgi:hypothetical protein